MLANAGGSKLCPDDLIRLFIQWIDYYHEAHFKVIREIYREPGVTRGRIWESIHGAQSAALHSVNGHLFTVMLQGLDHFESVSPSEKGTPKRGLAIFPFENEPVAALKFVGMLYSQRQLARIVQVNSPTPWFNVISPDGIRKFGIVLASSVVHGGEKYYLLLTAQRLPTICADQEVFISLLGGFDPPEIALDHTKPTSFLMFIYPSFADLKDLVQQFGTVDLS